MIEKLNIKHGIPMNEAWETIIDKINEIADYVNTLYFAHENPMALAWDLMNMPEEKRKDTAYLWDLCEEEINNG